MKNFPLNVLSAAQTVIGKQSYQIKRYTSRTRNAAGYWESIYSDPEDMAGSVQPVRATQYAAMGLDFKKAYIKIYDTNIINSLSRNTNADQIIYDGYLWSVAEDTPWFLSGGWNYVMCVRLEKYEP